MTGIQRRLMICVIFREEGIKGEFTWQSHLQREANELLSMQVRRGCKGACFSVFWLWGGWNLRAAKSVLVKCRQIWEEKTDSPKEPLPGSPRRMLQNTRGGCGDGVCLEKAAEQATLVWVLCICLEWNKWLTATVTESFWSRIEFRDDSCFCDEFFFVRRTLSIQEEKSTHQVHQLRIWARPIQMKCRQPRRVRQIHWCSDFRDTCWGWPSD